MIINTPTPLRLRLVRGVKGWNMQVDSWMANGLPGKRIDRATRWGNPFIGPDAVKAYKAWVEQGWNACTFLENHSEYKCSIVLKLADKHPPSFESIRRELGGHNLFCWCEENAVCHGDILLKIANQ